MEGLGAALMECLRLRIWFKKRLKLRRNIARLLNSCCNRIFRVSSNLSASNTSTSPLLWTTNQELTKNKHGKFINSKCRMLWLLETSRRCRRSQRYLIIMNLISISCPPKKTMIKVLKRLKSKVNSNRLSPTSPCKAWGCKVNQQRCTATSLQVLMMQMFITAAKSMVL